MGWTKTSPGAMRRASTPISPNRSISGGWSRSSARSSLESSPGHLLLDLSGLVGAAGNSRLRGEPPDEGASIDPGSPRIEPDPAAPGNRVAPGGRPPYNGPAWPTGVGVEASVHRWGGGGLVADLLAAAPRRLVILGSGTSTGVPVIGCECAVCRSADPRNKRTRCSVLLRLPLGNLLIDTSPEMRLQLVRERVGQVHAIAFTHHHADHLFGLDDARMFPKAIGGPVPIFCEPETEETIRSVFHYAFDDRVRAYPARGVPKITFEPIAPKVRFEVLGQSILPIRLDHGRFRVLGFRIGDLAYCTDVSSIP